MSRTIGASAHAKVNLTLEVVGRRDDGYHELRSVFALVPLTDDVRVAAAKTLDVRITPPLDAPRGDDLASRAVRAFAATTGREPRALVRVRKRIPVAAGLGGGSSDAGAVMRGLAELWRVPSASVEVAASVGSDVPFFLSGARFALVSGRGEAVDPLPVPERELWIAVVLPPVRVATAAVFAALQPADWSDGASGERLARAFRDSTVDATVVRECARNDLSAVAERSCSWIADARAAARAREIELHLSGTGPSLFAIGEDRRDALRIARGLRRAGLRPRALRLGAF